MQLSRRFSERALRGARAWLVKRESQATLLVWAFLLVAYGLLLAPMLSDFSTYGFHDWDAESTYRYITTLSVRDYAEGPWWHPWLCGGTPAWGYVEGATNLVSPYLPFYLLTDIRSALRVEVVGDGLIGLAGAYLLARKLTESRSLAGFFAALYVLNGRWALQTAVGHAWHLKYAFTPWVFYFFERARAEHKLRDCAFAGACLAFMCYAGGIYPLPQTALFLTLYACLLALFVWSAWPLLALLVTGVVALGLAAPKLFAVLDYMSGAPRLIASSERIGLAELIVMLTDPTQRFGSRPVPVPAYNWHEWGIYVGIGGLCALGIAIVFARGPRGQALKICGLLCLLLGFGAFHADAPWTLLHEIPPFTSQHVPSRFHYLMLFFLGLAFVGVAARYLDPLLKKNPLLDWLLALVLALFLKDLVAVNREPFEQAFWMRAPEHIVRSEPFEHLTLPRVSYVRRDWAAPMLLSMFANIGIIRCYGADPALVPSAIAADAPGYRGRAFVAEGEGRAELAEWTPNRALVRVNAATPGALVVYDMNFDKSWSADGRPALAWHGMVAGRLQAGHDSVRFSYFPRTLKLSLPLFALTLFALLRFRALCAAWARRSARRRPRAGELRGN